MLSIVVVVFGSACGAYVSPDQACSVPLGTSWSQELAGLSYKDVRPVGPPPPIRATVGTEACLPDGGFLPGGCLRLVGRPYSGGVCNEGFVGCWVWLQDDRVVGRAGQCFN